MCFRRPPKPWKFARNALLALCSLGSLMFVYVYFTSPPNPKFEGIKLSVWLQESYFYSDGSYRNQYSPELERAMKNIGTNAIPMLMTMIKRADSKSLLILDELNVALGTPLRQKLGSLAGIRRKRALNGFKALGRTGTNAVPGLLRSSLSPAIMDPVLASMGHYGKRAIVDSIQTGDDTLKIAGLRALSSRAYEFSREETLEVWTKQFTNENPTIRLVCVELVGNTKPIRAQGSLSSLTNLLHDADRRVVEAAELALAKLRIPELSN